MKKTVLISLGIVIFLLLVVHPVSAQEVIHDFQVDIMINTDGTVDVMETIVYDFGPDDRHGIFRDIPVIKTNEDGKKFRTEIFVLNVKDENGEDYRYENIREGDNFQIKIGDPNVTVRGEKTYKLHYKVKGAVTYFSDHDELYWNITGHGWSVPIEKSGAVVRLPEAAKTDLRAVCYTGVAGSTSQECTASVGENNLIEYSTTRYLASGENLTIVAGFPKNIVAVLEPKEVVEFWNTIWGKLSLAGLIIFAVWWFLLYPIWLPIKWYMYGRDPEGMIGEVRAGFDPPKTKGGRPLTPAETGTLIDERAHMREISALIVSLAQRGYLKIVEKESNDYYFVKQKDWIHSDLLPFEKDFLMELFKSKDEIHLKKTKLYEAVEDAKNKLYAHLEKEGFFPHNPQKIRTFYEVISGLAMFTFNFPLVLSTLIFGRNMPKKTIAGVEAANIAKSLKNFLTSQERQLEFQAKNQMMFEKLLPFAVAFGVEKIWADRFKDISLRPPEWYQGHTGTHFNSVNFTRGLNSSMAQFTTSATPTRSSSGYSSGFSGGSSGGGGGGGGGGSW